MSSAENSGGIEPIISRLEEAGLEIVCPERGYVLCPGRDLHTTANKDTDCIAYNNSGVPFLYCFHASCADAVAEVNAQLLAEAKGRGNPRVPVGDRRMIRVRRSGTRTPRIDIDLLEAVLRDFDWPYRAIVTDPEAAVTDHVSDQWPHLIASFPDDAVLWIGRDEYDSGKVFHERCFRRADEWLRTGPGDGAYICPNSFKPGSRSRSNENVAAKHFLVVESDELNRDQVGAVFRLLESEHFGMRLRAVVDTGGKSLHGWFEYPSPPLFLNLKRLLPRLGCDRNMFKLSQPTRLPSALRMETGRRQKLIYFH